MAGGWTKRTLGVDGRDLLEVRQHVPAAGEMTEEQRAARYAAVSNFADQVAQTEPEEFDMFPDR